MTMSPDLESLYQRVSLAIHRSEMAAAIGNASLAAQMHMDVSCLEEEIAALVPANAGEGEIARRGALSAAMAAGQYARVVELASVYEGEPLASAALRAQLHELRDAGQLGLDAAVALSDAFEPAAKFRFAA